MTSSIHWLRGPRRPTRTVLTAALLTMALLAANVYVARAHQLPGNPHWNKGGSQIVVQNYNYATNWQAAENARVDGWNTIAILYNFGVNYHTHVSVFDGNWGNTGWMGLGEIWWRRNLLTGHRHIRHGHARYNSFYPASQATIQGVFCQEIGHTWGLDHSDTGDCMGLGYFPSGTTRYGPHNNADFDAMYRNH